MRNYTNPPLLTEEQALANLKAEPRPWAGEYLAMYSSWLNGIITDPWLMNVPLDDHMVHRGDGVFETSKCIAGRIYQFDAHLARLARSAGAIGLELPLSLEELKQLACAVVRAGGEQECLVRIYASRGPGGFTTNPKECPEPGIYISVGRIHPPSAGDYKDGVPIGVSHVPPKSGYFASVKSCNYLPNVLLKSEALDKGWRFALGLDPDGRLAEGSTENFGLVDPQGHLLLPLPDHILEGTTVRRAAVLAQELVSQGLLKKIERRALTVTDLEQAEEVMLFGTTLDVLPVTSLEGKPIGAGKAGPVAKKLLGMVRRDITENPESSTPVF